MSAHVHRRDADAEAGAEKGDLLFALGWGNSPDHDPVDWLLDGLAAEGWTVHAVTLPENGTDFARDYVRPLETARAEIEPKVTAGHSLGGLTLAHLPGDDARVYSAPFWGFGDGVAGRVLTSLARIPVSRRLIPLPNDPSALGDLKPGDERGPADDGISPAWVGAVRSAQRRLPAFRPGSVVYCSLSDRVVSTRAIGRRSPAERVRLYDGGHEFFASTGRESTLERFCADLAAVAERD